VGGTHPELSYNLNLFLSMMMMMMMMMLLMMILLLKLMMVEILDLYTHAIDRQ